MTLPRKEQMTANDAGSETNGCLSGCLYVFWVAGVACLLLFINGGIVMALIDVISDLGPTWLRNKQLAQILLFVVPVVLLVIEWWMFDRLRRWGRR